MKTFQRFLLIVISFCLFFNVSKGKPLNFDFTHHSSKKSSFLEIPQIKKSSILIDYNLETIAGEGLQEETDSDDGDFNYIVYSPLEFSFGSIVSNRKLSFSHTETWNSLKIPLFIKFRNLRL